MIRKLLSTIVAGVGGLALTTIGARFKADKLTLDRG